ncbi:hypothetical protein [Streptomyces sp. AD55]|uniref:hypothetical protein n=1 Tax=Streptomyces sp. AD55 TaxID=3242895 RepID=UPI00352727C8
MTAGTGRSDETGRTGTRAGTTAVVRESYSFVCMRCGNGWEQSYDIEHHRAADDRVLVLWVADGHVVPSPLSRPTCSVCGGHVVRIMRPGRVASVRGAGPTAHRVPPAGPLQVPRVPGTAAAVGVHRAHHLLRLLQALHLVRRAG